MESVPDEQNHALPSVEPTGSTADTAVGGVSDRHGSDQMGLFVEVKTQEWDEGMKRPKWKLKQLLSNPDDLAASSEQYGGIEQLKAVMGGSTCW